jgi:outer membrane protein assembly factor BamD (BamD/ComL family)
MSSMKRWNRVAAILAGRWQIPLLLAALVAAGAALYRAKPARREVPFDALLADVLALAEARAYHDAANAAANLLEMEPPLPKADRAILHDTLAEIIFRQELLRILPNRKNAQLLLEHHEAALACGYPASSATVLRAAQAYEWLGDTQQALNAYRLVLQRDTTADARRTARQGLVRLLDGQTQGAHERREHIQALLDEEDAPPNHLWWALQHAIREALDQQDLAWGREVLTGYGSRLKRSDLHGYHDYLWAWLYTAAGQTERAAPLLDRVDQWLITHARTDARMDEAGFLPAMSRWLRGNLHLAEGRPQAALEYFDEVLSLQSHGHLLVATTIGQARALDALARHEAARQKVRNTLARLEGNPTMSRVGCPRLRHVVRELLKRRHDAGDYENTLAYVELALELTRADERELRLDLLEELGRESAEAAEVAGEPEKQRAFSLAAAQTYERAADLVQFDEPRQAAMLWSSAAQFDRAGHTAEARRLLRRFVERRSTDPRMPQALLRLGQARAADGELEGALECYAQLIEDYSPLEEALRARLLTATCLMAGGPEHYSRAEAILRDLLEDEHVAPQAQVFRDALFELCDLLYQRRAFAPAISHMEDFLAFYPQDPERYRIRFMLADAYRRSAYALWDDEAAGPVAARQRVSRQRFQRAAEIFAAFPADLAAAPGDRDEIDDAYERLALFYRGDCLFELNEPATLAEALAVYHQAAARYQGEPAALTAQVQIANVYVRQGKLTEAARAIERARWLLGGIPDQAFTECGDGMDRPSWDRFLSTVGSSHLFGEVFAGTQ